MLPTCWAPWFKYQLLRRGTSKSENSGIFIQLGSYFTFKVNYLLKNETLIQQQKKHRIQYIVYIYYMCVYMHVYVWYNYMCSQVEQELKIYKDLGVKAALTKYQRLNV